MVALYFAVEDRNPKNKKKNGALWMLFPLELNRHATKSRVYIPSFDDEWLSNYSVDQYLKGKDNGILPTGAIIAQFTRDVLAGAIQSIEAAGGEVVGFMGDAILGIIPTGKAAVDACYFIAKDVDRQCEWISNAQKKIPTDWEFAPGGPSVKISVEYGLFDVSTIQSRLLGEHRLFVGSAINYAARISRAGVGNRCLVGPRAAGMEFASYPLTGPYEVAGKAGEIPYIYHVMAMDETWIEGPRKPGEETYWD